MFLRSIVVIMALALVSCGESDNSTGPDNILKWIPRDSGLGGADGNLFDITWSGEKFVVVGSGGMVLTSPDGIQWSQQATGTIMSLLSVIWTGSEFAAVGSGVNRKNVVITSPDGVTWDVQETQIEGPLADIVWAGTQFVAVGGNAGSIIITSPDGDTWTEQNHGLGAKDRFFWKGVAWSGERYVAVGTTISDTGSGYQSMVISSPDAVDWTVRKTVHNVTLEHLDAIVWSGSQFVAVGENGRILTSLDGLTWEDHSVAKSVHLGDVIWTGQQFVAACGYNPILQSTDGKQWSPKSQKQVRAIRSVAYSGQRYVAVGEMATILSSP